MKKQNGITLIALIITIIVMLILVGVTINVALNGGLFTTAQKAADGTKKEAEKEQLLEAILAAVGTDGEVEFAKVVLPEGFSPVIGKQGVYTGKSGTTYTVNKKTLEITEGSGGSGGSEDVDNPILGTYYEIAGYMSGSVGFKLKSNNQATFISDGKENPGTYTYNENTKNGKITTQYEEVDSSTNEVTIVSVEFEFNYIEITDKSGNVINSILETTTNISEENTTLVFAKQGTTGLIPLTGYIYENGTETIEFDTYVENGITLGVYTITRSDGSNYGGCYVYYNGKIIWEEESEAIISDDYSTITINGTVYTKR